MELYENVRGGFQRLRPMVGNNINDAPVSFGSRAIAKDYMKFIQNRGPFYFFNTITFARNTSKDARFQYANALLHRQNQMLFGRDYKEKGRYIEGFAFIEDHFSCEMKDRFHIHILIENDPRYDDFDLKQHEDIFHKAASKIQNSRDQNVFNAKCLNMQKVYEDDTLISYCMKQVWHTNVNNIKMIGVDGLSDTEFKNAYCDAYLKDFMLMNRKPKPNRKFRF